MTHGQQSREFSAKLKELYPKLRIDYMSMCADGTRCRDVIQQSVDSQTINGLVLSRQSASWTQSLTLFIDYREKTIRINEMTYLTARPFETKSTRDSETVDNVYDMHRVIRTYFN
jgi:hypothetical protein